MKEEQVAAVARADLQELHVRQVPTPSRENLLVPRLSFARGVSYERRLAGAEVLVTGLSALVSFPYTVQFSQAADSCLVRFGAVEATEK